MRQEILEPGFDSLPIFQHFLGDVIGVDVDADCANDSKLLSLNGNRGAFEFSRTDVQLIIQFVFVQELTAFEVDQQICCTVA